MLLLYFPGTLYSVSRQACVDQSSGEVHQNHVISSWHSIPSIEMLEYIGETEVNVTEKQ